MSCRTETYATFCSTCDGHKRPGKLIHSSHPALRRPDLVHEAAFIRRIFACVATKRKRWSPANTRHPPRFSGMCIRDCQQTQERTVNQRFTIGLLHESPYPSTSHRPTPAVLLRQIRKVESRQRGTDRQRRLSHQYPIPD